MPGYPRNRNSGGPMRDRRNDGRSFQNRAPAQMGISPWESGVAPGTGTASSLLGAFQVPVQNQFLMNRSNQHENSYNMPHKIRRLDRTGNFDDYNGRGLLPSPNTSLMGAVPHNLAYTSRSSNLHQRLGNNWSSGNSTANRRTSSGYYPSNSSRRDSNSSRPQSNNSQSNRQSRSTRETQNRPRYNNRNTSAKSDKDKTISKDRDAKSPGKDDSNVTASEVKEGTQEKKVDTTGPKEEAENKETVDEFPAAALYCHVCDLETFATKKGYIRHLEGNTHCRMAEQFHEKNAALWEYLNASAKFAEMRRKDALIRSTSSNGMPLGRIAEKVILSNYTNVGICCKKKFSKQFDLHEHKLSVLHLRRLYEKGIEEKKGKHEALSLDSIEEIEETIKAAKETNDAEPLTVDNMPAFEPKTTYGLHYMRKGVAYKCDICKGPSFSSLEEHCQSYKHYENILLSINKEEQRKMEEARLDEKEEKPTHKYERHNDDDCESNLSEKNNDAKNFLSFEDDEIIILDEQKNEDEELNFEPEVSAEEKPTTDDILNDEPHTILDDMVDEPIIIDDQMVDEPMLEDQIVDEQIMDDQTVDEQIMDDQTVDEQIMDDQTVDEPIMDDQTVDEPIMDDQTVDEPIMDDQIVDEHVMDDQTVDTLVEDDIGAIGEAFVDTKAIEEEQLGEEMKEVKESPKIISPRRSSRVRL